MNCWRVVMLQWTVQSLKSICRRILVEEMLLFHSLFWWCWRSWCAEELERHPFPLNPQNPTDRNGGGGEGKRKQQQKQRGRMSLMWRVNPSIEGNIPATAWKPGRRSWCPKHAGNLIETSRIQAMPEERDVEKHILSLMKQVFLQNQKGFRLPKM